MKSKCLGNEVPTIKCAIFQLRFLTQSLTFSSLNSVSTPLTVSIVSPLCVCVYVWVARSCPIFVTPQTGAHQAPLSMRVP